jgi:hypothetical protein
MHIHELDGERYEYGGESIEVDGALTSSQYVACLAAIGSADDPSAHDPDQQGYEFEPDTARTSSALRGYLRANGISHSSELRLSWALEPEQARRVQQLTELLALARHLGLPEGSLDDAIYDAEAPSASQINNEGVEGQIRWLLGVNDAATVRRLIEAAAECGR